MTTSSNKQQTSKDTPFKRAGDHNNDSLRREHYPNVAPGEQLNPFGDGEGHVPAIDTLIKKESIFDPEATDPTQDSSADGYENLTEEDTTKEHQKLEVEEES